MSTSLNPIYVVKGVFAGLTVGLLVLGAYYLYQSSAFDMIQPPQESLVEYRQERENSEVTQVRPTGELVQPSSTPSVQLKTPPQRVNIPMQNHVYQTFNNCGPATLSMYLGHVGVFVSQDELGNELRPYQNPQGDNDDKSVTLEELARKAEEYNLYAYHRPNADVEHVKLLLAQDIPLIARTWLHPGEDIGHYRVVHGYDDTQGVFIQSDSYEGPNLEYSYDEFMDMWQDFNYEYLIVVPEDKVSVVEAVLGESLNDVTVWRQTLQRAEQEGNVFNQSVAHYHLGNYEEAVRLYESVQGNLPGRMLWYQIEPIQAYAALGDTERVFSLTDAILSGGNRAFSELYEIRADLLEESGQSNAARQEYELARQYNIYAYPSL